MRASNRYKDVQAVAVTGLDKALQIPFCEQFTELNYSCNDMLPE